MFVSFVSSAKAKRFVGIRVEDDPDAIVLHLEEDNSVFQGGTGDKGKNNVTVDEDGIPCVIVDM